MERAGGWIGAALCGGMGAMTAGTVVVTAAGGDARAWVGGCLWVVLPLALAAVYGLPMVGAAMAMWEVFWDG